uniref:Uncharacterized protein n=1 Tax=Myotis myotis TaxID=51298 RepID=A0A7J7R3X3_MYOMY|nr:hypothetical protein mMyoMyo1_010921 [Myotis myotis]
MSTTWERTEGDIANENKQVYLILEAQCMDSCTIGVPQPGLRPLAIREPSGDVGEPDPSRPGQGTPMVHESMHRASSMHVRSLVNLFPPSPLPPEIHQSVPCFHACALSICPPPVVSTCYSDLSNSGLGFYIYS